MRDKWEDEQNESNAPKSLDGGDSIMTIAGGAGIGRIAEDVACSNENLPESNVKEETLKIEMSKNITRCTKCPTGFLEPVGQVFGVKR